MDLSAFSAERSAGAHGVGPREPFALGGDRGTQLSSSARQVGSLKVKEALKMARYVREKKPFKRKDQSRRLVEKATYATRSFSTFVKVLILVIKQESKWPWPCRGHGTLWVKLTAEPLGFSSAGAANVVRGGGGWKSRRCGQVLSGGFEIGLETALGRSSI